MNAFVDTAGFETFIPECIIENTDIPGTLKQSNLQAHLR